MALEDVVRSVLRDPMNLPAEFLSYLPQYVAQNAVATAKSSGERIAYGIGSANVSTTGTTFAAGSDLLATSLRFTSAGSQNYILRVFAPEWHNNAAGNQNQLRLNLDGADLGFLALSISTGINFAMPLVAAGVFTPSAGAHSVNARLSVGAGTGTVTGAGGGAGNALAILVTLEIA